MYKFVVRVATVKNRFAFVGEVEECIYLFCTTAKDLQKAIRLLSPKEIRVRDSSWFIKQTTNNYTLQLKHPIEKDELFIIKRSPKAVKPEKVIEYQNSLGFSHKLKLIPKKEYDQYH